MHALRRGCDSTERVNKVHTHLRALLHALRVVAEADSDTIQIDGLERLCSDLGVDPTDPVMLMIAWQMRCEQMCVFTRQEWLQGMTEMGCDSIEALKAVFPQLKAMLEDHDAFRDYYQFCFKFAKEPGFGVRTLPTEVAKQMWALTLAERFPLLDAWNEFIDQEGVRAVTKDVWDMLLTFANDVDEDMGNYDDDGAVRNPTPRLLRMERALTACTSCVRVRDSNSGLS